METVFRTADFYATLFLRLESMLATPKSLRVGRLNFAQAEFRAATHQPFGPPLITIYQHALRGHFVNATKLRHATSALASY